MKKYIISLILFATVSIGTATNETCLLSGIRQCDTVVVTDNNSYLEDFTTSPECWVLMPGSNPWECSNGCLQCHYSLNYVDTSDAITPVLDIGTVTSPMLKFALKRQDTWGYMPAGDYLTVSFRNAAGSDTAWIPIVTLTGCTSGWRYDSVALPASISFIQLKFTCITKYYSFGISIDDVEVCDNSGDAIIPEIPEVTTKSVTGLTKHTATMHATVWNPCYASITSIGYAWKSDTDSNYTIIFTDTTPAQYLLSSSPAYTLEGLDAGIAYAYRAFITYNDTIVYGDEMSFITFGCDEPTGLQATDVGLDYFLLEWDNDTNVSAWHVEYYGSEEGGLFDGGELYTETNSATVHYEFSTMDLHHQGAFLHTPLYFYFSVQADCGDSVWGLWSDTIIVATPYVGISEQLKNRVSVFPNPATSYVDIRVDGEVIVTDMEVYDIYGKIVRTLSGTNNELSQQTSRIDISDLSAGMYFIRVNTDQGPVTKPFMKH